MNDDEKRRSNFLIAAARYTSIAMTLPAAVFVGYGIGYALDGWLGTTWLKIVFLLLGIASGFVQLFRELVRNTKSK